MTPAPTCAKLRLFTTEPPMDNFNDFVDLHAEIFDWEDDMMVLTEENQDDSFFKDFINSNIDFWNYYV